MFSIVLVNVVSVSISPCHSKFVSGIFETKDYKLFDLAG